MPEISFLLKTFVAIFVIVDPIGGLPLFLSLTADETEEERRRTALKGALAAFLVLAVFTLFGEKILAFFQISMGSFRVAGGALLFLIAMEMLQAKPRSTKSTPPEEAESREREDVALVPLGVPILAGPGAITTVIVLAGGEPWPTKLGVLASAAATFILTVLLFFQASRVSRLLGRTGANLMVRIMGLLLSVIAVEYMVEGLKEVFPALGGGA
ncbi:MarC family protein [Thermosulfurimonas sp. F29]|uniref:MarC family protein n=1 Tax=Thermosulfurimonas sp. F29 TaxID=2867247 RepID=UPI001C837E81|nr:MarC family protein [Thermosulfurimonas sp. F29]MBX6422923.1 MarC family protein [Thermosulfurimonas sp. F29]